MNWRNMIFVLIVVLIYIPMIFLGANVFWDKYTGADSYWQSKPGQDCYAQYGFNDKTMSDAERAAKETRVNECLTQQDNERRAFEDEKNSYDGNKYAFIAIFNLVILVIAFFWRKDASVMTGLFLGSVLTTFFATMRYFDTNSKFGFAVLVVTFFTTLFFITKRKHLLLGEPTDGKAKRK